MATVAIFGSAGVVGAEIARALVNAPEVTTLALFDVDEKKLAVEANDIAMVAEKLRAESVRVIPEVLDLNDVERVADRLGTLRPDISVHAAIPVSWYTMANSVPPEIWKRVNWEARMGPFLPLLLTFPLKMAYAWDKADRPGAVIQLSFPDVVNPVLSRIGLTPLCGSGNTENLCTTLRLLCADRLGVPVRDVTISLIAHHFHCWFMKSRATADDLAQQPFFLRVYLRQRDVTDELVGDPEFLPALRQRYPYQRPRFAATSVAQNVLRALRNDQTVKHVSSPMGFPGGIDGRFVDGRVEVVPPEGITEPEIAELLAKARIADGIQEIADDGTVHFTDRAHEAMGELLGVDCPVLKVDEVDERSRELYAKLQSIRS